jgi:hypothetical protein
MKRFGGCSVPAGDLKPEFRRRRFSNSANGGMAEIVGGIIPVQIGTAINNTAVTNVHQIQQRPRPGPAHAQIL